MPSAFQALLTRIQSGATVLGDGAWGTELQRLGLQAGDCPEEWNVTHPEQVRGIATRYFEAGAEFCLTNTFGANRYRLTRHGFGARLAEFNAAGARLSREAAAPFQRPVFGSVGPTGEYIEPEGMVSAREMYVAYFEQLQALKAGGVDAVFIETMYVVEEALEAIRAAKDLQLFCVACMTFDSTPQGFKTMLGASVADVTKALDASSADVIGTNCGNGINEMVEIARQMRSLSKKPLAVRSNAGLPTLKDGKAVYEETPALMAQRLTELRSIGVAVIGGCCGTTPEHIRAFRAILG